MSLPSEINFWNYLYMHNLYAISGLKYATASMKLNLLLFIGQKNLLLFTIHDLCPFFFHLFCSIFCFLHSRFNWIWVQEKDVEDVKRSLIDGYENSFWTCSVSKLGYSGTAIISRVCIVFLIYELNLISLEHLAFSYYYCLHLCLCSRVLWLFSVNLYPGHLFISMNLFTNIWMLIKKLEIKY